MNSRNIPRRSNWRTTRYSRRSFLELALIVSIGAHAAFLATRFVPRQNFFLKPPESPLQVVLVNSRSLSKAVNAKALAQADLNGGGDNERGRPTSFLSRSNEIKNGDALKEAVVSQVQPVERTSVLTRDNSAAIATANSGEGMQAPTAPLNLSESIHAVARMEAQIEKRIEDYSERPRRGFIGPSTKGVSYAMYYNQWREKIERVGTVNYPEEARGKLYGDLILTVTLNPDGTIYKDQVTVTRKSGFPVLDRAAARIVRLAAPYGQFPDEMRKEYDIFEITTRFSFTKGDGFAANLSR